MSKLDPISEDFANRHPDSFARVLARRGAPEVAALLNGMPSALAGSVASRLSAPKLAAILATGKVSPGLWLAEAGYDDVLKLLSHLPRDQCLTLVNSLENAERRRRLLRYLRYPAHSVGAVVTDVFARLDADTPAVDALAELRLLDSDRHGPVVVLEADGRYLGTLDLWRLLKRDPPAGPVRGYVLRTPVLHPEVSLAAAAGDPGWHGHNWMPALDHEGRLLGGVWRQRVLDAVAGDGHRVTGATDIVTSLSGDMFRVFGALLERVLARRESR